MQQLLLIVTNVQYEHNHISHLSILFHFLFSVHITGLSLNTMSQKTKSLAQDLIWCNMKLIFENLKSNVKVYQAKNPF